MVASLLSTMNINMNARPADGDLDVPVNYIPMNLVNADWRIPAYEDAITYDKEEYMNHEYQRLRHQERDCVTHLDMTMFHRRRRIRRYLLLVQEV